MARRLPSPPPVLPGFSHLHVLGSGGFADVFLYEQNMPRRQVAVKVLLAEVVNDEVRRMFQAEANLMAQLSAHPSVLTVYQASVSSDGRPYLVMELCSSALGVRYRSERLPVSEVLRIAIRVGGAIETAHRAGVLHRDIKPSNILLTAYGHPVLSDFGIAATLGEMDDLESVGMSIPWSAPEVLQDETPGSVQSEVWSLAATVYSLLAGRSPFEIPGGNNSSAELIGRISRAKPQPINREDVPRSLEQLIVGALSKKRDNRPASILDLITGFQAVETELGVTQTPIEVVADEWARATVADLDDRTVVRPVAGVHSPGDGSRRRRRSVIAAATRGGGAAPIQRGRKRGRGGRVPAAPGEPPRGDVPAGAVARSAARAGAASASARGRGSATSAAQRREAGTHGMRAVMWMLIASAVLVLALGATAAIVLIRVSDDGIPVVSDISATDQGGTVMFSWPDPGLGTTDAYSIRTDDGTVSLQQSRSFSVDAGPGARACITVAVNRDGKSGATSGEKCLDAAD